MSPLTNASGSERSWIKKKKTSEEKTRIVVEEVYGATIGRRLCKSLLATWLIFTQGKRWGRDLGRRKESAKEKQEKWTK